MSPVEGVGAWLRNPAGGTGTYRGVQLFRQGEPATFGATAGIAVPFTTAEYDTDSLQSLVTHTYGLLTVPIGASIVCPAGMAGLWRCSFSVGIQYDSVDWLGTDYGFAINSIPGPFTYRLLPGNPPGTVSGIREPLVMPSVLLTLASGDVLWVSMRSPEAGFLITGADPDTPLRTTWMLAEYLGAVPT